MANAGCGCGVGVVMVKGEGGEKASVEPYRGISIDFGGAEAKFRPQNLFQLHLHR